MNAHIGYSLLNRQTPDWSLWHSFAAVVSAGSLSAAARELGLSQPTLGRHVEALEADLGARLFERTLSGLKPTEMGLKLYEQVQQAERALAEAAILAAGAEAELAGTVRLTASEVTAHYTLPQLLRTLREEFPAVQIELVPTDSPENLLLREADIAVRMFRPTQLELVTRRIGQSPIVACAHQSYLARRGIPTTAEEMFGHDLIGLDRSDLVIVAARAMGYTLKRTDFALRCDSQTAGWEMAKAGLGITFAQRVIQQATPGMVALLPAFAPPPLEVWLTTHRELFTSRRIRAIYSRLAEMLAGYYGSVASGERAQ